jgi:hypothetical protein
MSISKRSYIRMHVVFNSIFFGSLLTTGIPFYIYKIVLRLWYGGLDQGRDMIFLLHGITMELLFPIAHSQFFVKIL